MSSRLPCRQWQSLISPVYRAACGAKRRAATSGPLRTARCKIAPYRGSGRLAEVLYTWTVSMRSAALEPLPTIVAVCSVWLAAAFAWPHSVSRTPTMLRSREPGWVRCCCSARRYFFAPRLFLSFPQSVRAVVSGSIRLPIYSARPMRLRVQAAASISANISRAMAPGALADNLAGGICTGAAAAAQPSITVIARIVMQKAGLSALLMVLCVVSAGCATPQHRIISNATPLAAGAVACVQPADLEAAEFKASDGILLRYRFLSPLHGIRGKSYPLVLQLHGSGGIGTDNLKQVDRLAKTWAMPDVRARYPAYVLMPQFPTRSANYGPPSADQHAQHSPALNAALELVEEFVSHHAVDKSRIYAVGFSMGGSAAWLAPTLEPNLFAAVVPVSGIAPADSFAPLFKDLPTLVIHGNADTENPIVADRRFIDAVIHIGAKNMLFREYDGLDHQLPAEIYPGYWWRDWLFEQSRR